MKGKNQTTLESVESFSSLTIDEDDIMTSERLTQEKSQFNATTAIDDPFFDKQTGDSRVTSSDLESGNFSKKKASIVRRAKDKDEMKALMKDRLENSDRIADILTHKLAQLGNVRGNIILNSQRDKVENKIAGVATADSKV